MTDSMRADPTAPTESAADQKQWLTCEPPDLGQEGGVVHPHAVHPILARVKITQLFPIDVRGHAGVPGIRILVMPAHLHTGCGCASANWSWLHIGMLAIAAHQWRGSAVAMPEGSRQTMEAAVMGLSQWEPHKLHARSSTNPSAQVSTEHNWRSRDALLGCSYLAAQLWLKTSQQARWCFHVQAAWPGAPGG